MSATQSCQLPRAGRQVSKEDLTPCQGKSSWVIRMRQVSWFTAGEGRPLDSQLIHWSISFLLSAQFDQEMDNCSKCVLKKARLTRGSNRSVMRIWVILPNKQHVKKQSHYFANKGLSSQSYGFSSSHGWIWGLDYKEDEHQRIDTFELWCWGRFLRVPWTSRRTNQSILKEISPGCSLEGLILKLKLQNFGHLMQRADSMEKTLMLGKIEGRRIRGHQRMRW